MFPELLLLAFTALTSKHTSTTYARIFASAYRFSFAEIIDAAVTGTFVVVFAVVDVDVVGAILISAIS